MKTRVMIMTAAAMFLMTLSVQAAEIDVPALPTEIPGLPGTSGDQLKG